ncbi:Xaa-Pro dipeptidyl-peptidase [Streptomyces cinnamoneus]|uniref:Xaa-Pro dipeptidyl-peptidase n=1 Tax=Streptomyces cinnamoneus TaxID=53446 RepID=A0A2G1XAG9_STRCJ|nr:Xaa-Pro dipeptidyl-peptidase [Streptomyces cinnamoneus]PHQ48220.1 Xaa-Pro dipeptidyl-peptidase [Streptomyces cinnamoneus]PPT15847.1 Xaa-Pro dipeptidyl-peptidase [Streptomyces cinnamoneus]
MPIPVRKPRIPWSTPLLAGLVALLAVLLAPPGAAHAAQDPAGARPPGGSRPVYSYDRAIRETVWVDTGLDGDGDGRADRVAADVIRPREAAEQGRRVPVIMDASPYYSCCGRGNESQRKTYDAQGNPLQFPLYYDNYFVPRGYAVLLTDLTGTNRSDGCTDIGGPSDVQSAKAVVDWLNGRARGYASRTGTGRVGAGWSTGAVGMIGKSYDGTVANAVAATGVKGLKTIVPIGAISSWYDYYFAKGAALFGSGPDGLAAGVESPGARDRCRAVQRRLAEGAPRTGDWTSLWSERDYLDGARKVRASVFAVHGKQDLNVRTKHLGQWWDALAEQGVERKIWLSTAGHVDPFDFRRESWVPTLHRWFDHYLLGYDNGIEREPMADVERAPGQWTTDRVWPPRGTRAATLRPAPGPVPGAGTLGTRPAPYGSTAAFTDDPGRSESDWAATVDRPTPDKVAFTTGPLAHDLRLAGSSSVRLTVTPQAASAHLSAVLVDLGPATIRDYAARGEGIRTLTERTCWGDGTPADTGCFQRTEPAAVSTDHTVFSRGWADLGHYAGLAHGRPLTPGTAYGITLDLAATDHVVPAGHRLALIVAGTDAGLLEPASTTPRLTVDLRRSAVRLPLVGGDDALARATADAGRPQARPTAPLTPYGPRPAGPTLLP